MQMKTHGRLFCVSALLLFSACGLILEEGRKVMAEVGGEPIRLEQMLRRIRKMPLEARARTNADNASVRLEARRAVLRDIVAEKLMVREAEARGVEVSEEEVKAVLQRKEAQRNALSGILEGVQGGAGSSHESMHGGEGFTRREIKEMRENILRDRFFRAEFSDTVLRRYYEEHPAEFAAPLPLLGFEVIFAEAANGAVIDMVRRRAAEDGSTLSDAYKSLDNPLPILSVGAIPLTSLDKIALPMREKVEKLKVGEISQPFYLRHAGAGQYCMARLISRVDKIPLENVRKDIQRKLYLQLIDRLQEKYNVVYHEENLNYSVGA